jgi:hypothetical protein
MNPTPNTPEIKQVSKPNLILIGSIVAVLILGLGAFSAYVWSMSSASPVKTTTSSSTSMSKMPSSSSMDNSKMNSMMTVTKSEVSSTPTSQTGSFKTLSCPTFDISINTDKYQAGFGKLSDSIQLTDQALLEQAKKEIAETTNIRCDGESDKSETLIKSGTAALAILSH